ncbi:hypothetical protein G3N94_17700 [Burkholderia sp. Ac-20353]|nr:hypothetical protein [Burkholderia sp. Ac-20353]MBN3788723.1 hypothetical protein [Burkholderia sp. Ac-20353]
MKRIGLATLGFVWGLLVTWAAVYTFSHMHWPTPPSHSTGCNDMEHCSPHAVFVMTTLGLLLWPALAFCVLNAVAYKRWSNRKWGIVFAVGTLIVVLFYLASYAVPASGLVG